MKFEDHAAMVDGIGEPADPYIFVASTGVKFRLRPVSRLVIMELEQNMKAPSVPTMFNNDKGRDEENPNDPGYIEAVDKFSREKGMVAINVYCTLGMRVEKPLPQGIDDVSDTEWAEALQYLGIVIPESGRGRYLAWLKFHAMTDDDVTEVFERIAALSGRTREKDVDEAVVSFKSNQERDTNSEVPIEETA